MWTSDAINFPNGDFYLLSAENGSTVWSKTGAPGLSGPVLTDHGTFYLGLMRVADDGTPIAEVGDMCCVVAEFSLVDGSEIWRQADDLPRQPIGYLTDWDVLITALPARSIEETSIVDGGLQGEIPMPYQGIDATTHETTFTFTPDGTLCSVVMFPVGGSGMVVCKGMNREISVFAPVDP